MKWTIPLCTNLSLWCCASSQPAPDSLSHSQPSVLELLWLGLQEMHSAVPSAPNVPAVPDWLLALTLFALFILPVCYILVDEWMRIRRKNRL